MTNIKQIYYFNFNFLRDVLSWGISTFATRNKTFTYCMQFTNYLPPPSRGGPAGSSPEVSITHIESYTPLNNQPIPVPNIPNYPASDPDPNSSGYSSLDSSDWLDPRDVKCKKLTCKKIRRKIVQLNLLKKRTIITAKLLQATYNSKFTKFKLDEDTLHLRVYFLNFMNSLKIVLSQFKQTYMFLCNIHSYRGREL